MANDLTTSGNGSLTLDQKISAVNELLQPVSADLIASTLIRMRNAGLDFAPGLDARRAADIYTFAMRGVCREGFKRASARIIQGTAGEVSGFIPKPPSFAALARSESAELWRERDRLMLTAESLSLGRDREPKSEEAKAKVRAMVAMVKAQADAIREDHRDLLYRGKSEDELNRIFRNKVDPPSEPPGGVKFDDDRWFEQHKENENGKENYRDEDPYRADDAGEPDGPGDGPKSIGSLYGFEGGGD